MKRRLPVAACLLVVFTSLPVSAASVPAITTIGASVDSLLPAHRGRAEIITPPNPPGSPGATLVIGDSAIAGLRWVVDAHKALRGSTFTLDVESCRRLMEPSCFGRELRQPSTTLEAIAAHARGYHTLVIATNYNDDASEFSAAFDPIIAEARRMGILRIIWVTSRVRAGYFAPGGPASDDTSRSNNVLLAERLATGGYPDVVVADFNIYTRFMWHWFITDALHYTQTGAWGVADYLTRKLAHLDGRACPVPVAPGAEVQNPCPDPDATGPIADIGALYPVSPVSWLCYEMGDDRHPVCGPDPRPGAA